MPNSEAASWFRPHYAQRFNEPPDAVVDLNAQPGVAEPLANVPKDYEARLVKMDFAWAADNRERILAEWTKRYNAKSEKR